MTINGKRITIDGKLLRIAQLDPRFQQEWFEDVENPEMLIDALQKSKHLPDIVTFWQRLPDTEPTYRYPMEWHSIAALPINGYSFWWEKQIDRKARNKIRKAQKNGIVVKPVTFDDRFVRGMASIFNETPIRQGRHYLHYGKDFETIKREFSRFLFREEIFGAYLGEELVGFIFLADADRYAFLGQIISKITYRDLAPNNALLAKAVERCAERGFPYLVYAFGLMTAWATSSEAMGFKNLIFPDTSSPNTAKGKLALRFGLHRGWKEAIPSSSEDR